MSDVLLVVSAPQLGHAAGRRDVGALETNVQYSVKGLRWLIRAVNHTSIRSPDAPDVSGRAWSSVIMKMPWGSLSGSPHAPASRSDRNCRGASAPPAARASWMAPITAET